MDAAPAPAPVLAGIPALEPGQLRSAATARHLRPLVAQVRAEAARAARTPPPSLPVSLFRRYEQTGDRLSYERAYFARRGRLNALAAVALLDPDQPVGRLAGMLRSVCHEHTWALPAHAGLVAGAPPGPGPSRDVTRCVDLFACETAHTLAEVAALLGDRLPAPVRDLVRAEVHRRVLEPYFGDPRPWPWESSRNNWAAVCAGAAGMAALAVWSRQPQRLGPALDRCLDAMATFRSGLGAAGGCAEGVDYWAYGFGYYTYFAEALRACTGLDLLAGGPVAAAAFPANVALAPGRFVTFSDATDGQRLPTGLLSRLRQRVGAPAPAGIGPPQWDDDECHRWAHLSRNLAWTCPEDLASAGSPVASSWLADVAWLVDRRQARDGVPVAFAAKGGHNDEPHNHNDLGQFIVSVAGEQLLTDLGAGEYRAGYFGAERYQFLHPSAGGHSVPVVDGRCQRPGRDAAAVVLGVEQRSDGADLALDLSAAYGDRAPVRRHLSWRAGPAAGAAPVLRLADRFPADADVDELFVSRVAPALTGGQVCWRGRRAAAVLRYDPRVWSPVVDRIETRDHHGAPDVVYRLGLRSCRPVSAAEFTVTLHSAGRYRQPPAAAVSRA